MTSLSRHLKGAVLNTFHNPTPSPNNHLLSPSLKKTYPTIVFMLCIYWPMFCMKDQMSRFVFLIICVGGEGGG